MSRYELSYNSVEECMAAVCGKYNPVNYETEPGRRFREDFMVPGRATDPKEVERWTGDRYLCSLSAVHKTIHTGYPKGLAYIEEILEVIKPLLPPVTARQRTRLRGDSGDYLDLQRVYAGDLARAWQRTGRTFTKHKGLVPPHRIVITIGGSCAVSAKELAYQGAYGAALVDLYNAAGYPSEVWAVFGSNDVGYHKETLGFSVRLTEQGRPISLSTLASVVTFPGFFRSVGFEAMLSAPFRVRDGLGWPVPGYIPTTWDQTGLLSIPGGIHNLEAIKEHAAKHFAD